jgi:uncharacterized RDD family membrane protein YckC
VSVAILTSQNVLLEYEPASVGDRILATLIDYLVFIAWLILVLALPAGALKFNLNSFYVIIVGALPILFYDLLFEWLLNGQTPGKIAMNIRVVMRDGSQPNLGAYLLRWLLRLVDTRIFGGLVAVIAIAANGKGQRLGDMAAGTTVVKLKPKVALDDVRLSELPGNYVVRYPEVRLLSDRDVTIIREVLKVDNEEVIVKTADKIKDVTGIKTDESALSFLLTVLRDYQQLSMQE